MTEVKAEECLTIDSGDESLFKLQRLIRASDIQHSAQYETSSEQILAFTTGNADIILYSRRQSLSTPIIKRIPWFQGPQKQILALCFNPFGSWLLCASIDGSLYIIPVSPLINDKSVDDNRWSTSDITIFPSTSTSTPFSRPTVIVWYEDIVPPLNVGIVGTEYGEVILVNLENGKQASIAHVNGCIANLVIYQDRRNESLTLLITSRTKQQWRLILRQRAYNCFRQLDGMDSYSVSQSPGIIQENSKTFTPTRSRLQGLKQLSVEKLAILRQKLVETKNQGLGDSLRYHDIGSNRSSSSASVNSDQCAMATSGVINPEPISPDAFLMLQNNGHGQHAYACYHVNTNHITVHGPDVSAVPSSIHKLFDSCNDILVTQYLFFVTDHNKRSIYIISSHLSETHASRSSEFNPECIIGHFTLENSKEVIHAVYKSTDFKDSTVRKLSQDIESTFALPQKLRDLKVEMPHTDTCVIVTNQSVYKIVLRKSLLSVFMELVLKQNALEKAVRLASIFGMKAPQLFEYAGDILLSNKEFRQAVATYKYSECRLLKSVLKFASAGHTAELLSCLTHCLASPAISELPIATRIHLSNLCVLAFIEMTLRASAQQSKAIYKDFLYFLSANTFYDELLAVNIAGQTCLWEVLHHLATQRGLYAQLLDILMKTLPPSATVNNSHPIPCGMLICLSESSLMQVMLINPDLARCHMTFVYENLPDFQIFVLQRLVTLYDPTSPVMRSRLVQCKARHRTTSYSSQSSHCDSMDLIDNSDEPDTLVEEIIECFLMVLLTLIQKKDSLSQNSTFMYNVQSLRSNKEKNDSLPTIDFRRRTLSAGFSHVALIRNADVYTWGSSAHGCLGTGPSLLRYSSARAISFFRGMKLEVFSVSCGHCHTLAVTNNGIYAWGGSQYGQLGLGKVLQCPSPELITCLAQEVIVDAVAGQYHSVALTADGRVFTWGWGVHGQLGHGNTDEKCTPTLVASLLGVVVRQVSAGHAHTLALSTEGAVYAFGCNVFGQLGIGTNVKSSIPTKVLLSERISLIATGYFHNLAVGYTNNLYIWGASPQVLRLQAQAQKKSRILEQQECMERKLQNVEPCANQDCCGNSSTHTSSTQGEETNIHAKQVHERMQRRQLDRASLKNINVGLLEEAQTHLKPSLIDTNRVKGKIIQISTGCHHNALLTKDGSLYTWGRNLDGQLGNGTKREERIPTALCYNPASIFQQVPPRQNHKKVEEEHDLYTETLDTINHKKNGNISGESTLEKSTATGIGTTENVNPIIKAIAVCCGYDYTIAIQPGGTVLAWGNNSRAQLGRLPVKDKREADDKLVLLTSSKRVVRLPRISHVALDMPSQVPGISTPVISYQSYDATPLAGLIQPLSVIEKSAGELTLHYVLEHYGGLYDSTKIMGKCIELGNYQACAKIARLQHNIPDAFCYELERLSRLSLQPPTDCMHDAKLDRSPMRSDDNLEKNTELFNKQVEKNLIESVEDCEAKNKLKIPSSKSLNSLQMLEQELYSFDCQGGSEELCKDSKYEDPTFDISEDTLDTDLRADDTEEWIENIVCDTDLPLDNETVTTDPVAEKISEIPTTNALDDRNNLLVNEISHTKNTLLTKTGTAYAQKNNITNEALKVIKFYLNELEHEMDVEVKCKVLQSTLSFWIKNDLSAQSLENVFLEHTDKIYYPLGLLLFCQDIKEKYLDANKNNADADSSNVINLFSLKFCLRICSMLLQHVDQGHPTYEYVKLLSSLMADHYGPPLSGYPGTSGNSTSKEMMEGIISTVSSDNYEARSFVHIKEPDAVYRFLALEEDAMVFTCGHHFPFSVYQTETIPGMETELLTFQSLLLPCTAQFLGKALSETTKPEIVCPLCIPRALGAMVKKSKG